MCDSMNGCEVEGNFEVSLVSNIVSGLRFEVGRAKRGAFVWG